MLVGVEHREIDGGVGRVLRVKLLVSDLRRGEPVFNVESLSFLIKLDGLLGQSREVKSCLGSRVKDGLLLLLKFGRKRGLSGPAKLLRLWVGLSEGVIRLIAFAVALTFSF